MAYFVAVEGPDGTGKSTLIRGMLEELTRLGVRVYSFREPGGTPAGEAIRRLLLDPETSLCAESECLLFAAMRAENARRIREIGPECDIILADRFLMSSLAYQGEGLGMGIDAVEAVNDFGLRGLRPDLNILLMVPHEQGLERKRSQQPLDRVERRAIDFHRRVEEGYLKMAKSGKYAIEVFDGSRPPEALVRQGVRLLLRAIGRRVDKETV